MKKDAKTFLEALCNAPSPSGYESPARKIWLTRVRRAANTVNVDVHGNAIATINPGGSPHVMIAGHIDEIGFQVCHIDDAGFCRIRTIGGHDMSAIAARRVHIHTEGGPIVGVIGKRPIHLMHDRSRAKSPPRASTFWVDCGFKNRAAASKQVEIGDPVTYTDQFEVLRDTLVLGRSIDNKVGAFVAAEVLRQLSSVKSLKAAVSSVATVQEEVGLRGAHTSAFSLKPDVGFAVDVTWATDNPGGDAREIGSCKLGDGPVLSRGPNMNPPLLNALREQARKKRIGVQMRALPKAAGNDANAIQLAAGGVAAAPIGIPQRYMHTPVEVCDLKDLDATVDLLCATIRSFGPKTSFIPQ